MNKVSSQVVNTLLIVIGGGILIFLISDEKKEHVYLLILGFVLLMYGLYRATNLYIDTKENPEDSDQES